MLTPQDIKIVEATAAGASTRELEAITKLDHSTVARRLQRPDLRTHLERIQHQAIEQSAQETANNITYLIKSYRRNTCKTPKAAQEKTHGWDATRRMAESIGILPAHAPSSVVLHIMAASTVQQAAEVSDVGRFLRHKWAQDMVEVVEGEVVEGKT